MMRILVLGSMLGAPGVSVSWVFGIYGLHYRFGV